MAFVSAVTGDDCTKKFMEVLQNDFKQLSAETRKKHPQIKEACDEAIDKLTLASNNPQASLYGVVNQILYPLVQGCESKDIKIIKFCLGTIQRLIAQQGIDVKGARHIVDCLWNLGQAGLLELKLLQTAALLMTTSDLVHGDILARTMVMCMRMVTPNETRDANTCHAAAATVRQLVALVFERALSEYDSDPKLNATDSNQQTNKGVKSLNTCASDAYSLLQDIIQLVNGDAANWLVGISDVPKTFGLELLETVLTDFSPIFFKITEFKFLLKEHVCALVIRLFSPNVKYRAAFTALHIPGAATPANQPNQTGPERPHYPVSMRLLRLVSIIIHKYHSILVTECEIFLSLTIKFLDPDKPLWQRALALEVLHKMTTQPKLLSSFCDCYDMKPHATNIFQDIVNALGAYVQSLFVASQINTQPGTQNLPQQPGFYWKGVWLPLCVSFEPGTCRSLYIDMLDRTDAPSIQDGYGISLAFACLMEIVRSIALFVEGDDYYRLDKLYHDNNDVNEVNSNKTANTKEIISNNEHTKNGHREDNNSNITNSTDVKGNELKLQLIKSSWSGLVWGLSVLAEATVGELDVILRALQTLTRVSGKMGCVVALESLIVCLCRLSLPPPCWASLPPSPPPLPQGDQRHVLFVGTALPTHHNQGQQQSFVMVSSRQVRGMKALVSSAKHDGAHLHQAWGTVLTTMQHLVWILGLKPSTGGSMKASRANADANAVMSTSAVMSDLPVLSAMLSQVFEASKTLDEDALHHLINALCKLSNEAMELAYSNREPSLFAVAKLLETGLANLYRVESIWQPITNHLLEVCQHPHMRMREWGVEAITYLVQAAFHYHHNNPDLLTEGRQRLLLEPLSALSSCRSMEVRSRQLECAARLLHSRGEHLGAAWPIMCRLVSDINPNDSPATIRSAFQCVQVICGDLLPAAAGVPRSLRAVLNAVAVFAELTTDLNISLTAVGLMWNISDYLFHNHEKLSRALALDSSTSYPELDQFKGLTDIDKLWLCLYTRLSSLSWCVRPSVRRAVSQSVFSCVCAHGSLLTKPAWTPLVNRLFYMLDQVQRLSSLASTEKVDTGDQILIHHTRNTAQKQWNETQVLALSGVARVFHSRFQFLTSLDQFDKFWTTLLNFVADFALTQSHEVSIAALKSFSSVISAAGRHCGKCEIQPNGQSSVPGEGHLTIWATAWKAWCRICNSLDSHCEENNPSDVYSPSQSFLTTLVQLFPVIFQHIRSSFTPLDVCQLGTCLAHICQIVPSNGPMDSIGPNPGPVSEHALNCLEIVQKEAILRSDLLPPWFDAMLFLCSRVLGNVRLRMLASATELFTNTTKPELLHVLVQALHTSFKKCLVIKSNELTRNSERTDELNQIMNMFIQVLEIGLPLAKADHKLYEEFWKILPNVLETFMFEHIGSSRLVVVVGAYLLGGSSPTPHSISRSTLQMVRKAALHSHHDQANNENENDIKEREEFARTCFETLLQYSMLENIDSFHPSQDESDPLAIVTLLERFEEVIERYSRDDGSTDNIARSQLSEISFVLKALATLTDSMKKAPKGKVDDPAWDKLLGLYPSLVNLSTRPILITSKDTSAAAREALLQYKDLLRSPLTK